MSSLTKLNSQDVFEKLNKNEIQLIDIREQDEFQREHIEGALSVPLSELGNSIALFDPDKLTVFMCRSGMRTNTNCALLMAKITNEAFMLENGLDGWRMEGLPIRQNKRAPLELNRQVQITAGTLVLIGVGLAKVAHPGFIGLTAFVGAGFVFAGISGWCGMASLLRILPWNRPTTSST